MHGPRTFAPSALLLLSACRPAFGDDLIATASVADAVELTATKQCPIGASCQDKAYVEKAYDCGSEGTLSKGSANIVEYRCEDGECILSRGLCNGHENCRDGSDEDGCDEMSITSSAQALLSPYDCFADFDDWKSKWSANQKSWCCSHQSRGCVGEQEASASAPTWDCQVAPRAGDASFALKQKWCCQQKQLWCSMPSEGGTASGHENHDCMDWSMQWSQQKKEHCCKVEKRGCIMSVSEDSAPYSCVLKQEDDTAGWSQSRQEWCCAARGVNCPDSLSYALAHGIVFDCKASTAPWSVTGEWSEQKKAWCCFKQRIACPAGSDVPTAVCKDGSCGPSGNASNSKAEENSDRDKVKKSTSTKETLSGTEKAIKATMDCSIADQTFDPLDMEGHAMAVVANVAECQERCKKIKDCAHFSYWKAESHCHVHSASAVPHLNQADFLAGPPTCEQDGDRARQIAAVSLQQRICWEDETSYMPFDSAANAFVPQYTTAPAACQRLCAQNSWCAHFTYEVLVSTCHLADADATPVDSVSHNIAGPPGCKDLVTFTLAVESVQYSTFHGHTRLHDEIKLSIKQAVQKTVGTKKDHASALKKALVNSDTDRRLSKSTDKNTSKTAKSDPLVAIDLMEVVLSKGKGGRLSVTVLIGLEDDVPSEIVQKILWDDLGQLEVNLAGCLNTKEARKVTKGIIHLRMLSPPSLLGGIGEDARMDSMSSSEQVVLKFGSPLAGLDAGLGSKSSASFASWMVAGLGAGMLAAPMLSWSFRRRQLPARARSATRGYEELRGASDAAPDEVEQLEEVA